MNQTHDTPQIQHPTLPLEQPYNREQPEQHGPHPNQYLRLLAMAGLSFVAMYVLMYAMVDAFANIMPNINQVFMAGLMTAPMILIELVMMNGMYHNRRLNVLIGAVSLVAGIMFFLLIRQQTMVSDKQFLQSMIPHHAGALLMCERASLQDAEVRDLCQRILASQRAEIDEMKGKLDEIGQ